MNTNHARKWQHSSTMYAPGVEKQVTVRVRKRGWITRGEKMLYSLIGVATIFAFAFIISFASSMYSLNKEVQSLEEALQVQKETNEVLSLQVEQLSLPERITRIAKDNGFKIQNAKVKHALEYKK